MLTTLLIEIKFHLPTSRICCHLEEIKEKKRFLKIRRLSWALQHGRFDKKTKHEAKILISNLPYEVWKRIFHA